MKKISLAFLVIVYFVLTHTNCDINTSSIHIQDKTTIFTFPSKNGSLLSLNQTSFEQEIEQISFEDTILTNEEKGRNCLKNISDCMNKDKEYADTTKLLVSLLFQSSPPFDLSHVPGVSLACQKDSQKYVRDFRNFKLWALKMYDSSAKIPSGILNGNVNQLGDFDMCMGSHLSSGSYDIHGQYCLAAMEVQIPSSPYLAGLHRLMQSHFHFKSKLEDPGHRVPRFSSINWAFCVPDSCSPRDVELGVKKSVNHIIADSELEVRIEVDPSMCQSANKNSMPISSYIGIATFASIIIWVIFSTLYDYLATNNKNEWITAFSLKKNIRSLCTVKKSADDIEAVHGIRFLNAFMLLFAHKSMALFFIPYTNRTEFVEYVGRPFTVLGRAASLYTDPFIMLSGTLTTYSLLGKLQRMNRINIAEEYFSRLLRIVPTFAALIGFCTFVLPWLGSGPMWNLVITHHSDICKQYWWRNLLFIHNYFGFKNMCLTHTHHVGIDTQLFFVSPFLIYLLWRWPKKGGILLIGAALVSTMMRYYVTYTMRLSNYIHFGTSIQQLFDTADNMYILPAHRATVYIMGIFLGLLLRNYRHLTLTKAQLRMGNTIALCSFAMSFLGPAFMGKISYQYDPSDAAWYAAFAPILWCFTFAWIIFTHHIGYKGLLSNFFSRKIFTLWTKISYTVYLTQFPIYFYNVGTTRTAEDYGFFRKMFNVHEYIWTVFLSAVLTLLFELPFNNIRNIIFKNNKEIAVHKTESKKIK